LDSYNLEKEIMRRLLDDLLNSLTQDAPVRALLVGAHWILVSSRKSGMASTILGKHVHGQDSVHDVGHLLEKSARQLAEFARSDNPLEAGIGVAAINSLIDLNGVKSVEANAIEALIEHGQGKNVALVGHFPFIPKLRSAVGQLWVIEQNPLEGDYPADAAVSLIPKADIVALSSSTLINHTLEGLLELCTPETPVMMLGPSTPLSPVLFDYGVTFLSGSQVIDEEAVFRTVGQGASFQQVEGVRLLTITKPGGI
jgi:uncharacterized protein (DUF4213/DUF364 family)